jgi:hypothetical protein
MRKSSKKLKKAQKNETNLLTKIQFLRKLPSKISRKTPPKESKKSSKAPNKSRSLKQQKNKNLCSEKKSIILYQLVVVIPTCFYFYARNIFLHIFFHSTTKRISK